MRVVIAGDFPEHASRIVGGIQAVIYYTLLGLVTYPDLEIHLLSCEKWGQAARSGPFTRQGEGWQAHYLPSSPRLPHTLSMLTVDRWRLGRAIRRLRPDIVHAHGQAAAYPWAAFDAGIPTIVTVHGINSLEAALDRRGGTLRARLRQAIWQRTEEGCLRRASDIVVISPFVAQAIRPATQARLHAIENPVDPALFTLDRSPVPGRILYVGSIQKRKGLADLVRALPRLRERCPQAHLRVAGGVPAAYTAYAAEVRQLVNDLGLGGCVEWLGHLARPQLLAELGQCALFCLPSHLEASPVVVAEAMAAACPVVTTDIPSTAHLVQHGENGLRLPAGDVAALAGGVADLLADEAARRRMGAAARRQAAARFSPARAAAATYALYLAVTKAHIDGVGVGAR